MQAIGSWPVKNAFWEPKVPSKLDSEISKKKKKLTTIIPLSDQLLIVPYAVSQQKTIAKVR